MAELNLILLGPPGAGKGTQGERLAADGALDLVVTGDILRAAVREGDDLGREAKRYMDAGNLLPDELIIGVILERIGRDSAADGFLLDGFPRSVGQAEALDDALTERGRELTAALLIHAPDDEIVKRLSGRRVSDSGRVYHVDFDPPETPGKDDVDGSDLTQREDDRPETIRKRLAVYHEQTEPLVAHYEDRGLLHRFDGTCPADDVTAHLKKTLDTLRLEDAV